MPEPDKMSEEKPVKPAAGDTIGMREPVPAVSPPDEPPLLTPVGRRRLEDLKARDAVKLSVEDAATVKRLAETKDRTEAQERQLAGIQSRGPLSPEEKKEMAELQATADRRAKHDEQQALAADKAEAGPFSVEQWRHLRERIADLYDHAVRRRAYRAR
jgi:hypothetical protein